MSEAGQLQEVTAAVTAEARVAWGRRTSGDGKKRLDFKIVWYSDCAELKKGARDPERRTSGFSH